MSENIEAATTAMNHRVTAMEKLRGIPGYRPTHGSDGEAQEGEKQRTVARAALQSPRVSTRESPQSQSPAWSTVVERGKSKHQKPLIAPLQPKSGRPIQTRLKRGQKKTGIIGTGTESNIPVIKTKLVSVFATRFSPTLEADTLCSYLTEKLGKSVTCRKIETISNRFSSFHVTAECSEVADMYDPQLWPVGIYVRRYFEARRPRDNNNDSAVPGSESCRVDFQQQPLVASQGSSQASAQDDKPL